MIYNHKHKGKIIESIDINEANLRDHIIKYESPPEFNKGEFKQPFTLHFELSLMHYLWSVGNYRYKQIESFLIWDVINEKGINVANYYKYFDSCLNELTRINGTNYDKLKSEL